MSSPSVVESLANVDPTRTSGLRLVSPIIVRLNILTNDWGTLERLSGHSYAKVLILGSDIPDEYHVEEYIGKQAAERQMGIDEDT